MAYNIIGGSSGVHYLVYFVVVTPLLLVWLFWAAANGPPPQPISLLVSSDASLHQDEAMTQRGDPAHYPQFSASEETTGSAPSSSRAASAQPHPKRTKPGSPAQNRAPSARQTTGQSVR